MADKKISQLDAIVTQSDTDLYEVSLNGAGSRKETRLQMTEKLSEIFVKTTGSVVAGAFPIYDPDGQNIKSSTIVTDSQLNISTPRSITLLENANSAMKVPTLQQVEALIPTVFTAQDTVYVDPDGNNLNSGTYNAPYADPFAASAAITGTVANPKLITVQAGDYNTTSFTLKPNQTFYGFGYCTKIDVTNPITLDSAWISADDGSFAVIDNLFWENNFDLDFSTLGLVKGAIFKNSILGNVTFTGASGNSGLIQIINCDLGDTVIEGCSVDIYNCQWSGSDEDITIQSSGSGSTSFDISNCLMGVGTDVFISGASGSTTSGRIFSSPIRGNLTLDSTFATLVIDAVSIPYAGITFTNGASASQVTIIGNAPTRTYDNLWDGINSFTGQTYTPPVAQNSSANSTAWNLNTAPNAKQTMTENTTLASPSNQVEGAVYTFKFVQDSTPRTLAFNSVYKFPQGVVPVVSTGSGAVDIFTFYSDGTNMRCIGIAQNIS